MSPRFLFAGLLGFGLVGMSLQSWLGGTVLLLAAIAGAIVIERAVVNPLWKLALRFASNPATTLDGAIESDAVAVSNFDRNGQGIIAVEVDGHIQQVLATLTVADRAAGARVRAGQRVRIEEVDSERQRCSVSLL
jgi:nitrous oxidase accessory protein NosD